MESSLFRQAALEQQGPRLWGELFLSQPLATRVLAWGLFAITSLVLVLLASAQYQRKVSVTGQLSPDLGLVVLEAPRAGWVSHLYVSAGDQVSRGQPLLKLSFEPGQSGTKGPGQKIALALAAQQAAIAAEFAEELGRQEVEQQQRALEASQLELHAGQLHRLFQQSSQLLALRQKAWQRAQALLDRGSLSQAEAELIQTQYLEQQNQQVELELEVEQIAVQRQTLRNDIQLSEHTNRQNLARLKSRKAALSQDLLRLQQEQEVVLYSPVAAQVSALGLHPGVSVAPGVALISLLPEASRLQAILDVPSSAIGFVKPGQSVKLRVRAFPYQKFGALEGHVNEVATSAVPLQAGLLSEPQAQYRITAALDHQGILAYGQQQPLLAGMELDADIKLEHRSLLEWLLEPLFSIRGG